MKPPPPSEPPVLPKIPREPSIPDLENEEEPRDLSKILWLFLCAWALLVAGLTALILALV